MAYFTDLFSPETYEAFSRSDRTISGFRIRQHNVAKRIKPGDKLVCYMTKLSRWGGILEVVEGPFIDEKPVFYPEADPFVVRFRVKPSVWLPVEKTIPIHENVLWNALSFTNGLTRSDPGWTGKLRSSLVPLSEEDGATIERLLVAQVDGGKPYPVNPEDYKKLTTHRVRRADKDVTVTVPDEKESAEKPATPLEARESLQIQALLADIGSRMGMRIWVPRADKNGVLGEWKGEHPPPLDRLPLNYDETTLRTIEQIDVIWLKGRAITRAFEVEHTTSVYSGLLRMADLLALQPNMDIRLHIVAPDSRREKVFQEIRRPVFSLLDRAPLSEVCTFLSYDSLRELAEQPHLVHLSDSVLDEYEETAEGI
ncbi:MAG: EVE domain-containing protein [Gemmatimonadales bacterium]|nr:EVE domain-containing protein [Gemmatimonadales bacterium]